MAMCVSNESLQNVFELHKQRNNTSEAKRGQTCPKRPKKTINTPIFKIYIFMLLDIKRRRY
jgi:hypothetical protein